jgi:curved DNA-binding protein CbpA
MSHLYGVLGVSPKSDRAAVKAAYRSLAKTCHPDIQGGDERRFKEIAGAYAVLASPAQRAAYDAQCALTRARARRQMAGALAAMAASFTLTVGSGVAVAGWLLGA